MGTFFIVFATWLIVPIFLLGASIECFLRLKKLLRERRRWMSAEDRSFNYLCSFTNWVLMIAFIFGAVLGVAVVWTPAVLNMFSLGTQ